MVWWNACAIAFPCPSLSRLTIGLEDALVGLRVGLLHPREQGRTDVEGKALEVVDDPFPVALGDAGEGVGPVSLVVDAFVPVVEGGRPRLLRYGTGGRILAGWLVEVRMDGYTPHAERLSVAG